MKAIDGRRPERAADDPAELRGEDRRVPARALMATAVRTDVAVERLDVAAYTIPTDEPESDGTLEWDSTTIVVVEAHAGDAVGLGYTYADASARRARRVEARRRRSRAATRSPRARRGCAMGEQLRNVGRPGAGFMALSAVDNALWDLKARLLELPLVDADRRARTTRCRSTASGGFCSYSLRAARRAARRLGRAGHPAGEDEGRRASRSAIRRGSTRRARRSATTPSSTSTRTARSRGSRRSPGWSGSTPSGA